MAVALVIVEEEQGSRVLELRRGDDIRVAGVMDGDDAWLFGGDDGDDDAWLSALLTADVPRDLFVHQRDDARIKFLQRSHHFVLDLVDMHGDDRDYVRLVRRHPSSQLSFPPTSPSLPPTAASEARGVTAALEIESGRVRVSRGQHVLPGCLSSSPFAALRSPPEPMSVDTFEVMPPPPPQVSLALPPPQLSSSAAVAQPAMMWLDHDLMALLPVVLPPPPPDAFSVATAAAAAAAATPTVHDIVQCCCIAPSGAYCSAIVAYNVDGDDGWSAVDECSIPTGTLVVLPPRPVMHPGYTQRGRNLDGSKSWRIYDGARAVYRESGSHIVLRILAETTADGNQRLSHPTSGVPLLASVSNASASKGLRATYNLILHVLCYDGVRTPSLHYECDGAHHGGNPFDEVHALFPSLRRILTPVALSAHHHKKNDHALYALYPSHMASSAVETRMSRFATAAAIVTTAFAWSRHMSVVMVLLMAACILTWRRPRLRLCCAVAAAGFSLYHGLPTSGLALLVFAATLVQLWSAVHSDDEDQRAIVTVCASAAGVALLAERVFFVGYPHRLYALDYAADAIVAVAYVLAFVSETALLGALLSTVFVSESVVFNLVAAVGVACAFVRLHAFVSFRIFEPRIKRRDRL